MCIIIYIILRKSLNLLSLKMAPTTNPSTHAINATNATSTTNAPKTNDNATKISTSTTAPVKVQIKSPIKPTTPVTAATVSKSAKSQANASSTTDRFKESKVWYHSITTLIPFPPDVIYFFQSILTSPQLISNLI